MSVETVGFHDRKTIFPGYADTTALGGIRGIRYNADLTVFERLLEIRINLFGSVTEVISRITVASDRMNDAEVFSDYDESGISGWVPVADEDYGLVREFVLTWLHEEALKSNALLNSETA